MLMIKEATCMVHRFMFIDVCLLIYLSFWQSFKISPRLGGNGSSVKNLPCKQEVLNLIPSLHVKAGWSPQC